MQNNTALISDVLCDAQIGVWIIELSDIIQPKMYCNQMMLQLLGIPDTFSPEEVYQFWFERIHPDYIEYIPDYIEYILEAIKQIQSGKKAEVEYPWNHPQLEWTYVRCDGSLDKTSDSNVIRINGYHQDITELLGISQKHSTEHEIKDFYKLKKYSSYFMENYDELFEVDLETYSTITIFYKKINMRQLKKILPFMI